MAKEDGTYEGQAISRVDSLVKPLWRWLLVKMRGLVALSVFLILQIFSVADVGSHNKQNRVVAFQG